MKHYLASILFAALVGAVSAAEEKSAPPSAQDVQTPALSEAETLLWMTNHLSNITKPTKLRYEFTKSGSMEDGFKDDVELQVKKVNQDGSKHVEVNFFTGARQLPLTPQDNVTGNLLLAVYLDGDVQEMHRLAEGGRPYFQRRLKFAFAESAKIENVQVDFKGQKVEAKKIAVAPYVKDPKRSLFEKFAAKTYEFTLSEKVPGSLFQIHTRVPGAAKSGQPSGDALIDETLTFVEATDL